MLDFRLVLLAPICSCRPFFLPALHGKVVSDLRRGTEAEVANPGVTVCGGSSGVISHILLWRDLIRSIDLREWVQLSTLNLLKTQA